MRRAKTKQNVPDTSKIDRIVLKVLRAEEIAPKDANIYDVISATRLSENEVRDSLKRLCTTANEG